MTAVGELLWHEYEVPDDVAGWVHSFATVAETYPACIVISDMSMPGNPMFFVNAEFCRVTGYAKTEAQGRNCRFLQGPRTEPQSVAVIQDTLRRGVDCHVKITNYRKSGELFENLLTMRPVHDSNGVYRFCIGVQFEVTRDMSLKSRLAKLDKLVKLLPTTIEVSSAATGLGARRRGGRRREDHRAVEEARERVEWEDGWSKARINGGLSLGRECGVLRSEPAGHARSPSGEVERVPGNARPSWKAVLDWRVALRRAAQLHGVVIAWFWSATAVCRTKETRLTTARTRYQEAPRPSLAVFKVYKERGYESRKR